MTLLSQTTAGTFIKKSFAELFVCFVVSFIFQGYYIFFLMKELAVIFFCTWKFAATFPVAIYVMKMSFIETLIYTNIGGIIGDIIFLNLSDFLVTMWNKYWPESLTFRRKKRKIFTGSNRRFVRIKIRYGLLGIVILSPSVLSIPVGSFLAAKYYGTKPKVYAWMIAGQIFWSVIYTIFYTQVKTILV